ncbi:MAG: ABC transporter permease [Bacteroidales bacterium]|jgi:ABC-type transport system involved in multi-copper enzyme maturation permease subunit|nr:ABC transporter permease [Bacteroidales bacterium]
MKNLITHELQQFLYGLRFFIALSVTVLMFIASSLTYINENKEITKKYHELTNYQEHHLREVASNASKVATNQWSYQLPPRNSGFISDCGELNMPNTLLYNAFYTIGFDSNSTKSNPFILPSDRINWGFIILVLFSFLAVIFSFDVISGEREKRTLALCLSNPIKRSHILISKFLAINIMLVLLAFIGILLALSILIIAPSVNITGDTFLEIGLFLLFVIFFTGSMVAIGMLTSVICRYSHVSLLLSISFWLVFMIAIPNFSQTIGMNMYPIEKSSVMWTKIGEKRKEIEASFPDGKWTSNGGNPFIPQHKIRAEMMMAFAKNQADFLNEHRNEQFKQLEKIRLWTWISPLSVFEYGTEALLDGGYSRLKKNYDHLQSFKIQYQQWFKDLDAKDQDSPHWYNPYEDFSTTKKPVSYEEIPKYKESNVSIGERLTDTLKYLAILSAYMGIIFLVTIFRFERYDVR